MRKLTPTLVAIVDSTALIDLVRVNLLETLPHLFQEIYIPESVYQEVVIKGRGKIGSREVSQAPFLIREKVQGTVEVDLLKGPLSQTDAEVIALAKEKFADVILTRDRRLRRKARQEKLNAVLTSKFYVQLKTFGFIESVKAILDEIKTHSPHYQYSCTPPLRFQLRSQFSAAFYLFLLPEPTILTNLSSPDSFLLILLLSSPPKLQRTFDTCPHRIYTFAQFLTN